MPTYSIFQQCKTRFSSSLFTFTLRSTLRAESLSIGSDLPDLSRKIERDCSQSNYALALVLKVQLKLCTSMNFVAPIRESEKLKCIKRWFHYFIGEKKQKRQTWLTFCLPTKLLTNFEVAAAKSSRHFCRQLQSDNGCLHQQTNLLTVFGPRGFNRQLVHFANAVRRNIFQSKLNHGKEKFKFLLLFVPNYSLGNLTSKTFSKIKMGFKKVEHI